MKTPQIPGRNSPPVHVIGAGIAGTWQALLFAKAGCEVALYERSDASMTQSTGHWAGGMLAPYCEGETAEYLITRLGLRSLDLWREAMPQAKFNGSLVVAHPRDRADIERFDRLAGPHRRVDADEIAKLEPALAGRFREGLYFEQEGHLDPREALPVLHDALRTAGVSIEFNSVATLNDFDGTVIDCRGIAARDACSDLRGVKGEIIVVETKEIELSRPIRLVHPRWPLYIVPRVGNRFLIGATSIEADDEGVSVRSALELLTGAYAVHPAFAEARIVDIGAALRPAFPDNLPRVTVNHSRISVNGLYRHGFLLAPALAEITVAHMLRGQTDNEVVRCL
jgi:glycine oxidase